MFRLDTLSAWPVRGSSYESHTEESLALAPSHANKVYLGRRLAGDPTVLVLSEHGVAPLLGAGPSRFDWGWACPGSRRLAEALLADLTGRSAPPAVRDALACEGLAHLRWGAFALSWRELLDWVEDRGYAVGEWAAAAVATPVGSVVAPQTPC
jgi:hypothetical protein